MFVLGSGSAMAGAYTDGSLVWWPEGFWLQDFDINEGPGNYFNVISVTGITGGSFYFVDSSTGALGFFVDRAGHNTQWSLNNGPTTAYAYTVGTFPPNGPEPLITQTTAESFGVAFSEFSTGLTFYVNLFLVPPGTDPELYTTGTPLDSYEFTYPYDPTLWTSGPWEVKEVPEPPLVLLLGIGLGAVGLMVWRRGI